MAKYDITFSCGHEGTVCLFGKSAEREKKIKYLEEYGLCRDCQSRLEDEQNYKTEGEYKFPRLTGTEKQIKWARSIRRKFIIDFAERFGNSPQLEALVALTREKTSASFWINCSEYTAREFIRHNKDELNKKLAEIKEGHHD